MRVPSLGPALRSVWASSAAPSSASSSDGSRRKALAGEGCLTSALFQTAGASARLLSGGALGGTVLGSMPRLPEAFHATPASSDCAGWMPFLPRFLWRAPRADPRFVWAGPRPRPSDGVRLRHGCGAVCLGVRRLDGASSRRAIEHEVPAQAKRDLGRIRDGVPSSSTILLDH